MAFAYGFKILIPREPHKVTTHRADNMFRIHTISRPHVDNTHRTNNTFMPHTTSRPYLDTTQKIYATKPSALDAPISSSGWQITPIKPNTGNFIQNQQVIKYNFNKKKIYILI